MFRFRTPARRDPLPPDRSDFVFRFRTLGRRDPLSPDRSDFVFRFRIALREIGSEGARCTFSQ
jgi:hypothetical protein